MLELVDVGPRHLSAYRGIAPDALLDDVTRAAERLRGARVLHLNATPYGGGVSELLRSVVPLLNDLGVVAHWKLIRGGDRFFDVTKRIHNGLQGATVELSEADREAYLGTSRRNADLLDESYDFVVLHDPQPAGILGLLKERRGRWIWRCHIDTSAPSPEVWAFLREHLSGFDAAVFTMEGFVPPDLPIGRVEIIPPAIDPLSPKNLPLPPPLARAVLEWIGIELDRPLVTQISRFDPWKDPLGVIQAYRLARRHVPDLQLALVGSMALDDPEGWEVYRSLLAEIAGDGGIHVFTNLVGVGNVEVNAFQQLSRVVVQKSIREGFGLVVAEALWKGTPVVAGRAGGIPLQMADGVGGLLVDGVEACAHALVELLNDPARGRALGEAGRERVRHQFLIPRLLLNELTLLHSVSGGWTPEPPSRRFANRDPVCGMAVEPGPSVLERRVDGVTYRFCSIQCAEAFDRDPRHYLGPDGGTPAPGA
ncbi:MAG: glycosyltransferase [Vicinamibacterales bacterium]